MLMTGREYKDPEYREGSLPPNSIDPAGSAVTLLFSQMENVGASSNPWTRQQSISRKASSELILKAMDKPQ